MDIALNQKQYDFFSSTATNTGFVAGLGSGKTYVSTLKTIIKKIQNPTLTCAVYLPNYGLVRDIAFARYPELLTELGIPFTLNKSDKEILIPDMDKIIFRSMENPDTIVGFEVFYSVIDECDILPEAKMTTAYHKILARNRQKHPEGLPNQIDVVGSPEGFKWFYKRYVTEFDETTDALIRASTYDNKHLPAQYIANLERQYTPELLKAYLEGEFVNLRSGTVYSYFDRHKHHAKVKVEDHETIRVSMDFNVGGCAMSHSVLRDGILYVFKESAPVDTLMAIEELKTLYPNKGIKVYPDASGRQRSTNASRSDIDLLEAAGFVIEAGASNPAVEDRINTLNLMFHQNKVRVDTDSCPILTKALEQQAYDDKGAPEKFSGAGTIDDFNDSLGYKVYRLFALSAPKAKVSRRRMV